MQKVRLGVLGLGNMGSNHLRIATMIPQIELVGGFDPRHEVGEAVCKAVHAKHFDTIDAMLHECDAVVISVPTLSHHEAALKCLRADKHVLVEKPMAATLKQAREMAEVAEARGCCLQVGHVERYNPTFRELKNILHTEKMLAIEGMRLSPFAKQAADVSVTFDLLIHDLDLLINLIGLKESQLDRLQMTAHGIAKGSDHLNYVICQFHFPNRVLAKLSASKITQEKIRTFMITCEESFVVADFLAKSINVYRHQKSDYIVGKRDIKYQQSSLVERVLVPNQESLYAELRSFAESILNRTPPEVGAADGILAIALAERIEAMARPS